MQPFKARLLFLAFAFLLQSASRFSYCQVPLPVKTWIAQLQAKEDPGQKNLHAIQSQLYKADSAVAFAFFSECKKIDPSSNHYFNARVLSLTAGCYLYKKQPSSLQQVGAFYVKALNEAYLAADEALIAYVSLEYGTAMEGFQELELATTYLLNAAELSKKLMFQNDDGWRNTRLQYLGELLFHARLYEKSIYLNEEWHLLQYASQKSKSTTSVASSALW